MNVVIKSRSDQQMCFYFFDNIFGNPHMIGRICQRERRYLFVKWFRCGSRIWSRGGPQLLRPKVADIAKWSRASEASILQPGSRALKRALEAFGFLMLKYAFSHILETLFPLFLTSILTPKVDKNRALDFTSINLRHSDMLHLFFNLHEKVML